MCTATTGCWTPPCAAIQPPDLALSPAQTTAAGARGLAMWHTHTLEQIDIVYALDQHYDTAALEALNHFLRVGFYPREAFVRLDTGRVRRW